MHKLLIKTHNITNLKYLCYTRKKDHDSYSGSGKLWKQHLTENGFDVSTELLLETDDFDFFKQVAINKSLEFDVVNSENWANLKIEEGDGGDTVSNKRWITNGVKDVYIDKTEKIPEGWKFGRNNCVFNDIEKQKEFNSRADKTKKSKKMKLAWTAGKMDKRDHSKCGIKGDTNPAKRSEIKEKIRNWQLNRTPEFCQICGRWFKNLNVHMKRSRLHNGKSEN